MSRDQRGIGGPMHIALLRSVMLGAESVADIRNRIGSIVAKPEVVRMIDRLHTKGYLHIARGGRITLTVKARELAIVAEQAPMTPYVPPKRPPVRSGSLDFLALPSVAAGIARPYRHPV